MPGTAYPGPPNGSALGSPISSLALRCTACGAPYGAGSSSEILTCAYCGTTSRQVDARQFLDHFQAQVAAFLRQAIPPGLDLSGATNVDPVARLAAFNSSIRPQLSTESEKYRFSLFHLLSSPFVVLPFGAATRSGTVADATSVSVFSAKVHAVSSLAADSASQELLRRASGIAGAYQCLLVASNLASSAAPERLHLMAQNFTAAATALGDTGRWSVISTRLSGLAAQSRAADSLLTPRGNDGSADPLAQAQSSLARAREGLVSQPEIGFMHAAVDQEIACARVLGSMVRVVRESNAVRPHPLAFLQRLTGVLDQLAANLPPDWAGVYRSFRLREEVFNRAAELRIAQAGRGSIRGLAVGSGLLAPFWVVELPYTFETGALWNKHGKEAVETLLVSAMFPTDPRTLSITGARLAVTDVFLGSSPGFQPGQLVDRVTGKQQRISESRGLTQILSGASMMSAAGQPAVPPLTTSAEAIQLVQWYVQWVRTVSPKIASQLRASSPRVTDLLYVPVAIASPTPLPWMGNISPGTVGNPNVLSSLAS